MNNLQMLVGDLTIEQFTMLCGQILGASFIFSMIFYIILRIIDFLFVNLFNLADILIHKTKKKKQQD